MLVVDDVLPAFAGYRAASLRQSFADEEPVPGVVFHGLAQPVDGRLPRWIREHYPSLTPTLSLLRRSPAGQDEPTYIHTDRDMGDWTGIYYLNADPAPGDGTTFWRRRDTGAIECPNGAEAQGLPYGDMAQWEPWWHVTARPNRLLLFPAALFHSRALVGNYGSGDTARLIQVVFGSGAWPLIHGEETS